MRTAKEVASHYGVKIQTVIGWIKSGQLKAINVASVGSDRPRYRMSDDHLREFELLRAVVVAPKVTRTRRPKVMDYFS